MCNLMVVRTQFAEIASILQGTVPATELRRSFADVCCRSARTPEALHTGEPADRPQPASEVGLKTPSRTKSQAGSPAELPQVIFMPSIKRHK